MKKLDFHFNIALSAINIAKVAHWYALPKEQRNTFSMKNIKIINHNALLLERFFSMFAIIQTYLKIAKMSKNFYYMAPCVLENLTNYWLLIHDKN